MGTGRRDRERLGDDLELALQLADMADTISLARFGDPALTFANKSDMSPVTEVDQEVERALRLRLAADRPGTAILGEEYGGETAAEARWILDPIDGTRKYARGIPLFATLIALEEQGQPVLGVASAPALGRRWWAARGYGAFADGRQIHVSGISSLAEANILHGSIEGWIRAGKLEAFAAIARRSWATSGSGDFWIHMLVAEGCAEAALDPEAKLWDLAALKVIVEEAGGRFTDLSGHDTAAGESAFSSNGWVHREIAGLLGASNAA